MLYCSVIMCGMFCVVAEVAYVMALGAFGLLDRFSRPVVALPSKLKIRLCQALAVVAEICLGTVGGNFLWNLFFTSFL